MNDDSPNAGIMLPCHQDVQVVNALCQHRFGDKVSVDEAFGLGLLDNFCSFKSWDCEVFAGQQAAKGYDGVMGHLSISIDFHMIHRYS